MKYYNILIYYNISMALVFNRENDNYLFTIAEARGKVGEKLRLRSANSAAAIDICNNGNVDISGTFTVNGDTIASGDTVVLRTTNQTITGDKIFNGTTTINTVDIDGGAIDGVTIATSDITVGTGKTLNVSDGTLTLADNQISGDKVDGGTIASITISQLAGVMDCNNQAMTNVDINSGTIDGATIATSNITVGTGKTLNVSDGTLTLADNQISGDKVDGGTIASITISQLAGVMDCNNQAMTNVDINSGTIDGATIATSNITVGTGKTLNVSDGTLTLADNQISGDKVDGGTIASITISQLAGVMDCNNQDMTNVDINSGTIDGTVIGATTATTGKFTTLELSGNLLPSNTTAQIPVTKSTFTLVTSGLGDLSGTTVDGLSTAFVGSSGDTTFHNAGSYTASRIVLSGNSLIKMEFKVNFISSPEADQTISFRVRRTIGATTTTVFTDENIGSNMGVTFRNVYNGTFIDDLGPSTVTNNTSVTYQLQYKRNCPGGDTISTPFGIVAGGNYIFLQELYCP